MKTKTIIAAAAILFTACQKQPTADFTADKTEYSAGDIIRLQNTSKDAKHYNWTLPNGETAKTANVDFETNLNAADALLTFKLEATSRNGKKQNTATKTISLKHATGDLLIYTTNTSTQPIAVSIDGVAAGTITMYYAAAPSCAANGCVTVNIPIGSHTISATDGVFNWNGTIDVAKNLCNKFQLQ